MSLNDSLMSAQAAVQKYEKIYREREERRTRLPQEDEQMWYEECGSWLQQRKQEEQHLQKLRAEVGRIAAEMRLLSKGKGPRKGRSRI